MSMSLVLSVAVFIVVAGSIAAILWWRMSAQIAPYRDEIERQERRAGEKANEQNVVVIEDQRAERE